MTDITEHATVITNITERATVMGKITAFKSKIEGRSGIFVHPERPLKMHENNGVNIK